MEPISFIGARRARQSLQSENCPRPSPNDYPNSTVANKLSLEREQKRCRGDMGDKGETEHPPFLVSPVFHSNAPLLFNLRLSAPAKWLWLVDGGTSTPPPPTTKCTQLQAFLLITPFSSGPTINLLSTNLFSLNIQLKAALMVLLFFPSCG